MNRKRSEELFEKARELFPGGVNSPARAFQAVEGAPLFIEKGSGSRIWDADGNEFIDLCCSFGPLILGHAHPKVTEMITTTVRKGTSFGTPTELESELAGLILRNDPYIDKMRFVNSGTEATMSALRLARGYTGRNKIIKFEGCYHGHVDSLLVKAGSGLATLGTSSSAGVPEKVVEDTLVLPLNDKKAVEKAFQEHGDDIATIIIEPVPANNGLLLQDESYLHFLREICDKHGSLLIFDEVISGFRLGMSGAAGHYDIQPDLAAYGKIIGGGMPVGAFAGKQEIMDHISPLGKVYQAGTLSGNPVAMAAGLAQLTECAKPGFYDDLRQKTRDMVEAIDGHAREKGYPFRMFSIGSIFWCSFSDKNKVREVDSIVPETGDKFKILHRELLNRGIYLGPSGFEVGFVSAAHSVEDLEQVVDGFREALGVVFE